MASESEYSTITETQERLIIVDCYIISSIGLTLTILILYSLTNLRRKYKRSISYKYDRLAVICGMISCITAITIFLIKILFTTDLILPLNYSKNINIATTLDTFILIFWVTEKLTFYYGFAFLYASLFSKGSMDNLLKITMVLFGVIAILNMIFYLIFDVNTAELNEISVGEKRGIYAILPISDDESETVKIAAGIGILADFIMVILLIYKFWANGTRKGNKNGSKGIVLLCISWVLMMVFFISNVANFDIKFLIASMVITVDVICLYLMFEDNQDIYDNLCGWCGCCGSKYGAVEAIDVDVDDGNEQIDESNQQLV